MDYDVEFSFLVSLAKRMCFDIDMWQDGKCMWHLVEYYLHWTTTFEISFSGNSDTNRDSL